MKEFKVVYREYCGGERKCIFVVANSATNAEILAKDFLLRNVGRVQAHIVSIEEYAKPNVEGYVRTADYRYSSIIPREHPAYD